MSKIETSVTWGPTVLGREKLDVRRWAYVVAAPFDMQADQLATLTGMTVSLDGAQYQIRGVVPNIPNRLILAGEPIELLVVADDRGVR